MNDVTDAFNTAVNGNFGFWEGLLIINSYTCVRALFFRTVRVRIRGEDVL